MVAQTVSATDFDVSINRAYLRPESEATVYIAAKITPQKKAKQRRPFNVCLLFDTSSSMRGDKLLYAKASAKKFIQGLMPKDYASIITFDTDTKIVVECRHVDDVKYFEERIDSIRAGGQTNLYDGLQKALEELQKPLHTEYEAEKEPVQRIILLSDGRPYPKVYSQREYEALARQVRERGISMTCFGIGVDYNEDLLSSMASNSNGVWHHVSNYDEIPSLFSDELKRMTTVVQPDAHLEIKLTKNADLLEAFTISPQVAEIKNIRKEDSRAIIPLTDIVANEEQVVSLKIRAGGRPKGVCRLAQVALLTRETRIDKDIIVTYTDDEVLLAREDDAYPRTTFMVAQTTIVGTKWMNESTNEEKTRVLGERVKTILADKNVTYDAGLKTQMLKLETMIERMKEGLSEDEKKKSKDALITTIVKKE